MNCQFTWHWAVLSGYLAHWKLAARNGLAASFIMHASASILRIARIVWQGSNKGCLADGRFTNYLLLKFYFIPITGANTLTLYLFQLICSVTNNTIYSKR